MQMEFHEIAGIFPLLEGKELQDLADDIRLRGLIDPIWLYENQILDGRNRYRACLMVGNEPHFDDYDGDDPLAFVISKNLKRRHLNPSQLGFVALRIEEIEAKLAVDRIGRPPGNAATNGSISEKGYARDLAAKRLGVSHGYVGDAKRIRREAPELEQRIMAGEMHITHAMRELKEAARQQKREENAAKLEAVPELAKVEEVQQLFTTIVADPPWDWGAGDGRDLADAQLYGHDVVPQCCRNLRCDLFYTGQNCLSVADRRTGRADARTGVFLLWKQREEFHATVLVCWVFDAAVCTKRAPGLAGACGNETMSTALKSPQLPTPPSGIAAQFPVGSLVRLKFCPDAQPGRVRHFGHANPGPLGGFALCRESPRADAGTGDSLKCIISR